jgi:hypothetical protein
MFNQLKIRIMRIFTFVLFNLLFTFFVYAQRDTIVGWTFPSGTDSDKYANFGTSSNVGSKYIGAEDTTAYPATVTRTLSWTNGVVSNDYAATANYWNEGANAKLWSIKFTGTGYKDFRVSSKQRAGNNPVGPKYFKIQFKIGSSGVWTDVPNGNVALANDWTTGVVNEVELPDAADDPASSMYIRWIMTSNENLNGSPVDSLAISKIDDIFITAVPVTSSTISGDTIALWSFPTGVDTVDIYPNEGLATNATRYLSAEDTTEWPNTIIRELTFTNGVTDFAATAEDWQDGANAKLWAIKFKAPGYKDLKVSSKQRSGGTNPGPRDWKIQARIGTIDWIELTGGNITVANDWTTGVANQLELPDDFDNPGTQSIYVRWIMTSNNSVNGTTVDSLGVSKIDDVIITGTSVTGVEQVLYSNKLLVYPNPANDNLNIATDNEIRFIGIYNIAGSFVKQIQANATYCSFDVSDLEKGTYLVRISYAGSNDVEVSRFVKID